MAGKICQLFHSPPTFLWKLPQQLESCSARHDSREGGNLLLSGSTIFMCCHLIKKPNSLMMSVFCSETRTFVPECCKSIIFLRGPDFTIFPETWAFGAHKINCTFVTSFFSLHLLQSFCHLLKILLKTLEIVFCNK